MGGSKTKVLVLCFCVAVVVLILLFLPTDKSNHPLPLEQADEVSFALYTRPEKLDINSQDISVEKILYPLHLGLVTHDYKDEIYSGVARSWQVSEDKLDTIFELNTDLVFHNGKKLTCADVEASFANILNGNVATPLTDMITSIECVENDRFIIHLNEPSSLFLALLTHDVAYILPKEGSHVSHAVVGIGPYKLKEMTKDHVLLESTGNHPQLRYWSPKRIRYPFFDDVSQAVEAFDQEKVNIVDLIGFPVTRSKNETSISFHPLKVWLFSFGDLFNASDSPHDEILCIHRQVDRKNLVNVLNKLTPKIFSPAHGLIRPHTPGYVATGVEIDPQLQCGSGQSIHQVMVVKNLVRADFLDEIKKNFADMGVPVEFSLLTKEELMQRLSDRHYDMALFSINVSHVPEQQLNKFYAKKSHFSFANSLPSSLQDDLNEILSTSSKSQRANKIYAFEKDRFENPVVVPLLFQKTSYLIRDCLSAENITMTSSYEKLQEVGMIKDCE